MARTKSPQVFLETSAIIRFFTRDDEEKFQKVTKLFLTIEAGKQRAVTSNIIILETIFVLHKLYGFRRSEISEAITKFLELRSLVVVEKMSTKEALELWRISNMPYGDCCIATQVPKGALLATFDTDFRKVPSLILYKW